MGADLARSPEYRGARGHGGHKRVKKVGPRRASHIKTLRQPRLKTVRWPIELLLRAVGLAKPGIRKSRTLRPYFVF